MTMTLRCVHLGQMTCSVSCKQYREGGEECPPVVRACVHCGDPVTYGGGFWIHVQVYPDGSVHTGKLRCQSTDVAYGHLAHPADVPCPADGPNPCLGARGDYA